jgi:hypothetical protein
MKVIIMNIDNNVLVPMTEANQNFSKVVRLVDERHKLFNTTADSVIAENLEALQELAK